MSKFRIKSYRIPTEKIHAHEVRILFFSDLHGCEYGENNCDLIAAVHDAHPDLLLMGGDMFTSENMRSIETAERLVEELSATYPICYAYGNHEQSWQWEPSRTQDEVGETGFFDNLKEWVTVLDNDSCVMNIHGEILEIRGLSLSKRHFRKPFPAEMNVFQMADMLPNISRQDAYQILLAHNPFYGDAYFMMNYDLTLSGHYHGGVWRFTENYGLISTHFHPFPRYCCGKFQRGRKNMIVSGGLGEHTVKVRIHNPRELIEIILCPLEVENGNTR